MRTLSLEPEEALTLIRTRGREPSPMKPEEKNPLVRTQEENLLIESRGREPSNSNTRKRTLIGTRCRKPSYRKLCKRSLSSETEEKNPIIGN
jgi:hypothetical protein